MSQIIFYSWQSDLPNPTNRGFIERSLEEAAKAIANDGSVAINPVIDRDTKGMSGSPDIASAIFGKISAADAFVADVSIIGKTADRYTPNPNVLIELGFALKALGHERVILIFNEAYGKIDQLPFDLRMRRLVIYSMHEAETDRATERIDLKNKLDSAIRAALAAVPNVEQVLPAVYAIENNTPNKIVIIRRNLEKIFNTLTSLEPRKYSAGGTVEDLISAIDLTQESVAEFSKIAEMASIMGDLDSIDNIYQWFGKIYEHYNVPPGQSGRYSEADYDYYKFIGHELMVTLVAFLIREKHWEIISRILEEPIPLRYLPNGQGPGNEYWEYASDHLHLLLSESPKRKRISLHADILHTRHTEGGLSAILPFEDFVAADYFLFLYGELPDGSNQFPRMTWRAWSTIYMEHAPLFIRNSEKIKIAEQLAKVFKLANPTELKNKLTERAHNITLLFRSAGWDNPLRTDDIKRIATR